MKRATLLLALLCAACASAPTPSEPPAAPQTVLGADRAGNRIEALEADGDRFCTVSRDWCVDALGVTYAADGSVRAFEPAQAENEEISAWAYAVFIGEARDHALFGVISTRRDMYSGGGASVALLTLYEAVAWNAAADPLLSVTLGASVMIRACFSEADTGARHGACHDEYSFAGALSLDPNVTEGHPRFIYETAAATYPGRISREQDNARELRRSDLVWARDEVCSYRRVFTLVLEAEGYVVDAPAPECTDYQVQ